MSQITVGGSAPPGNPAQDNPLVAGGSDGAAVRALLVDSSGRPLISGAGAAGSPVAGNPVVVAGSDGSNARILGVNPQNQQFCLIEGQKATYTAVLLGFAPAATATDFLTIFGSASKIVRILRLRVTGVCTTGTIVDLLAIRRSAADSGGTSAALTAVAHDVNDAAATAALFSYSVNPTGLGAVVGNIMARKLALVTAASNILPHLIDLSMGTANERAWVLRGTAQGICLSWNSQAVPAGTSLDVEVTWSEE